jgi:opacity protein-like surface antigen
MSFLNSLGRKLSILTALIGSIIIFAASGAYAASVFVQPPVVEGPDGALRETLYELVKSAVSNESGYSLATNEKEADVQLKPRLLKLGGSFVVTIDKMKGEKLAFATKMKAATADDLDNVAARVVRAALRETRAEETAQVDDITQDETTRGTNRIQTTRQWKLGFGPAWGSQNNTDKSGMLFTLGFVWGIDANFDLDLALRASNFEKANETGASFSEFLIGTNYYLTKGRNAPFLTAGFGRTAASISTANSNTIINISSDTLSGWSVRAGVGYKFFRTSTVNLGVELNYSKVFGESTVSKQAPGLTSAVIALYY